MMAVGKKAERFATTKFQVTTSEAFYERVRQVAFEERLTLGEVVEKYSTMSAAKEKEQRAR